METRVSAFALKKRTVTALFDDARLINDGDPVRVLEGATRGAIDTRSQQSGAGIG